MDGAKMQAQRPLRGSLAEAMYCMLVIEAMSFGICLKYGIEFAVTNNGYNPLNEDSNIGMLNICMLSLLIYVWLGVAGYLVTLPLVCMAMHKLRSTFLYGYLAFRILFTLATAAIGIILGVYYEPLSFAYTLQVFVPPVAVQGVLGLIWIAITVVAITRLNKFRKMLSRGGGKEHEMAAGQGVYPSGTLQHHQQQQHGAYGNWNPYWSWYYGR